METLTSFLCGGRVTPPISVTGMLPRLLGKTWAGRNTWQHICSLDSPEFKDALLIARAQKGSKCTPEEHMKLLHALKHKKTQACASRPAPFMIPSGIMKELTSIMQTWLINEAACPPAVRQEPDKMANSNDGCMWLRAPTTCPEWNKGTDEDIKVLQWLSEHTGLTSECVSEVIEQGCKACSYKAGHATSPMSSQDNSTKHCFTKQFIQAVYPAWSTGWCGSSVYVGLYRNVRIIDLNLSVGITNLRRLNLIFIPSVTVKHYIYIVQVHLNIYLHFYK